MGSALAVTDLYLSVLIGGVIVCFVYLYRHRSGQPITMPVAAHIPAYTQIAPAQGSISQHRIIYPLIRSTRAIDALIGRYPISYIPVIRIRPLHPA